MTADRDAGPHDFSWAKMRRHARFALGSVRRRWKLFLVVSGGMVALTAGALAVLPRTYEVECRLLVNGAAALLASAADERNSPTRTADEMVLREDSLHDLIRETDLVNAFRRDRAPLIRFRSWVGSKLGRPPPQDDEVVDTLTAALERRLSVTPANDGTIEIRLRWSDPLVAQRLVDAAQRAFLERRYLLEVSSISEVLSILEGHATRLRADVESRVDEVGRRSRSTPRRGEPPRIPAQAAVPVDLLDLRVALDARRRAVADLEGLEAQMVMELQARLAEQRTMYTDTHPAVVDTLRRLETFRSESSQLRTLRLSEAELRKGLARRGASDAGEQERWPTQLSFSDVVANGDTPALRSARAQLRTAQQVYRGVLERIADVRIQLDRARAAFRHRYVVVTPPTVPRSPVSPRAGWVLASAVLEGILLGVFATTAADQRGGPRSHRRPVRGRAPRRTANAHAEVPSS